SLYLMKNSTLRCLPSISEIDIARQELNLQSILQPPFKPSIEEKNWGIFVHNNVLLCIYSFRPYVILAIDLRRGIAEKFMEVKMLDYKWYRSQFISNSTNPVSWDEDHYIMFIHDYLEPPRHAQRNRIYMQYAALISKTTLLPTSVIPKPLLIGGTGKGRHPGVHYTMSLVNRD